APFYKVGVGFTTTIGLGSYLEILNNGGGVFQVNEGGTGVTTSTGTGSVVLSTSPSLVTPLLGTPTSGTLTNCTFPTLNQSTTGSAASLSISGQTGLLTVSGLTSTNRNKVVRDAADTILELGGSYTPTGTWTSLTLVTPALGTPASGVITNLTGTCTSCVASSANAVNTNTFPAAAGFTSGGIPYFSSTTAEASSALLTHYGLVYGGGSGGAPVSMAACGANFPVVGSTGPAAPACSTIAYPASLTQGGLMYA